MICASMASATDSQLLSNASRGDNDAAGELLARYWTRAYRYALAISGDASTAEDAAQDAFISALASAETFDPQRPLEPWLLRIVRNQVRMTSRGGQRRRQRESRAARPERVAAGTDDDTALVLHHLARLEPELKAAVSLKYIDGLTFREIAETLDCAEGTAASRVRRGLAALKQRLEPELVGAVALPQLLAGLGDPSAPIAPHAGELIEQALRGSTPAPVPSASAPAAPTALKATTKLAAAILPLGLALAVGWVLTPQSPGTSRPGAPPDLASGAENGSASAQDPRVPARTSGEQSTDAVGAASGADAAAPTRRFTGRVHVPEGASEAWVRTERVVNEERLGFELDFGITDGREAGGWNVPEDAMPLAGDGRFTLDLSPGLYALSAGARGCFTRAVKLVVSEDEPPAPELTLTWCGVAKVRVTVLDADRQPLANTRLHLGVRGTFQPNSKIGMSFTRPMGLDAKGGIEFEKAPGRYAFDGWLGLGETKAPEQAARLVAGDNPTVWLRIGRAAPTREGERGLSVRVLNEAGEPVVGAFVNPQPAKASLQALSVDRVLESNGTKPKRRADRAARDVTSQHAERTDADGRATFPELAPGDYLVFARAGGRGGRTDATVGAARVERELVLDESLALGSLTLRFFVSDGGELRPLPENRRGYHLMNVAVVGARGYAAHQSITRFQDSSCTWADVPVGPVEVTVWGQSSAPDEQTDWAMVRTSGAASAGVQTTVDVVLTPTARITGQVLDPAGQPVTGGNVAVIRVPALQPRMSFGGAGKIGADGRFSLTNVRAGEAYDLTVSGVPGYTGGAFKERAGDEDVVLRLSAGASVVVADETGEPFPGVRVSATTGATAKDRKRHFAETDANGRVVLCGVQEGRVRFWINVLNTIWKETVELQPGADPIRATLPRSERPGRLSGRVVDAAGAPVKGARLDLVGRARLGYSHHGKTDSEGRFVIESLRPGPMTIQATSSSGFPAQTSRLIEATIPPAGHTEGIVVTVFDGVAVGGFVVGDAPLDGLEVTVTESEARYRYAKVPVDGENGKFDAGRLPPGRWTLRVIRKGVKAPLVTLEINAQPGTDRNDIDLRLN